MKKTSSAKPPSASFSKRKPALTEPIPDPLPLLSESLTDNEKTQITEAVSLLLGKVSSEEFRERMLRILKQADKNLAAEVAYALRLSALKANSATDDKAAEAAVDRKAVQISATSLSTVYSIGYNIRTRQIAILAADGVNSAALNAVKDALIKEGAVVEVLAPGEGFVQSENGNAPVPVNKSISNAVSAFYDAVYIPGGQQHLAALAANADAVQFLNEAYRNCKAIAADRQAIQVLEATSFYKKLPADFSDVTVLREGITIQEDVHLLGRQFMAAISRYRFWDRDLAGRVTA